MQLSDITYPVYKLREEEPQKLNGVLFYFFEKARETFDSIENYSVLSIIDDTNLPGDTLALRRLIMRNTGTTPYKLNRAIFFLGDLIKMAKPKLWFIDSKGKVFKYSKVTRARLVYRKVEKIIPITSGGALIEVEGISSRLKSLFMPSIPFDKLYAGILIMNRSLILYGFYDTKYKDTWRMV